MLIGVGAAMVDSGADDSTSTQPAYDPVSKRTKKEEVGARIGMHIYLTHANACKHLLTLTHRHTRARTRTHTRTDTQTHTNTDTDTRTQTHTDTRTQTHTDTHNNNTPKNTLKYSHTYIHTYTHTHTCIHTHTE